MKIDYCVTSAKKNIQLVSMATKPKKRKDRVKKNQVDEQKDDDKNDEKNETLSTSLKSLVT